MEDSVEKMETNGLTGAGPLSGELRDWGTDGQTNDGVMDELGFDTEDMQEKVSYWLIG